jgi:putative colanic acid biosynthesis UDP-glucose lipid carrier transferase
MNQFAPILSSDPKALASAGPWSSDPPGQAPGIIQQYGGALVRLGVLADSAIILVTLYRTVAALSAWNQDHLVLGLLSVCLFGMIAHWANLYRSWRTVRLRRELVKVAVVWAGAFAIASTTRSLLGDEGPGPQQRLILMLWFVVALAAMTAFRVGVRMGLRYSRAFGHDHRRIAFVGDTDASRRLAAMFQSKPWMGMDVVGFYGDAVDNAGEPDRPLTGSLDDLLATVQRSGLSAIYICLPMAEEGRVKQIVDRFSDTTVSIYYCPPLFGFDPVNAGWGDLNGHPVISIVESPFSGPDRRHLKRAEDLILSTLILILIAPFLLLVALAIKSTSPGPVLFRQTRYGLDGREFQMLKFRTMHNSESSKAFVQATRNDPRVTPIGAFLRKTSIDELPQFFNVMAGHMSIVGPRPHPVVLNEEHRKLIPRYMLRHIVKPGITGWAQINGYRGETETVDLMRKRVEFDLHYIKRWSIGLDLRILLRTLVVGFAGPRAY